MKTAVQRLKPKVVTFILYEVFGFGRLFGGLNTGAYPKIIRERNKFFFYHEIFC